MSSAQISQVLALDVIEEDNYIEPHVEYEDFHHAQEELNNVVSFQIHSPGAFMIDGNGGGVTKQDLLKLKTLHRDLETLKLEITGIILNGRGCLDSSEEIQAEISEIKANS